MYIYLDNAATTKLDNIVKDYVIDILENNWANPSSPYSIGIESKKIINESRRKVAKFINAECDEIIFTSSGSASNTLAILGWSKKHKKPLVLYSPIAHKSMLLACKSITSYPLKVDNQGFIDTNNLEYLLNYYSEYEILVALDYANSEIGTIQNVKKIINICNKFNVDSYLDCTGSISTVEINVKKIECSMMGFSGHKIHALKGVGVLYKKNTVQIEPLIYGSQENGLFSGTENILGIASIGKSVELINYKEISCYSRDYVWNYIKKNITDAYIIGSKNSNNRLPHNLFMCFKFVEGESLMILLDMNRIQVSVGSACNSKSITSSTALSAIGMDEQDIHSCIRMTFSGEETKEELDYVCETLKQCVEKLRNLNTQ
jgi:cysteine desulfurase